MEHEATKQTPYELVFGIHHGKKPKLPQIRNMIDILPRTKKKKKKKEEKKNKNVKM